MNRSTFWMIKYMNGSVFSKARYMNRVGFEILARTPVPKLALSSPHPPPEDRTGVTDLLPLRDVYCPALERAESVEIRFARHRCKGETNFGKK